MSDTAQYACLCGETCDVEKCQCPCCTNNLDCCKSGKCKEAGGCCANGKCEDCVCKTKVHSSK